MILFIFLKSPMTLPETEPRLAVDTPPRAQDQRGFSAALSAYLLWGVLPLLFKALEGVPAALIVAERTLFSLLFVGIIVAARKGWGEVRLVLASLRRTGLMLTSALFLAFNWLLYVFSVETGQVLEASFGYFINPLVNVALGMVLLGERQRPLQAVAIAVAVVAIGIQAWGLGQVPFIALGLAISFGLYGYLRKTVPVGSATGLFVETALLAPLFLAYIVIQMVTVGLAQHDDPTTLLLLAATGPATALPLLLFAYGVRRLRLTTIGMLQYIAPTIQFALAITVFGEELNGIRLFSFVLIWLSLALFTFDSMRGRREDAAAVEASNQRSNGG